MDHNENRKNRRETVTPDRVASRKARARRNRADERADVRVARQYGRASW